MPLSEGQTEGTPLLAGLDVLSHAWRAGLKSLEGSPVPTPAKRELSAVEEKGLALLQTYFWSTGLDDNALRELRVTLECHPHSATDADFDWFAGVVCGVLRNSRDSLAFLHMVRIRRNGGSRSGCGANRRE